MAKLELIHREQPNPPSRLGPVRVGPVGSHAIPVALELDAESVRSVGAVGHAGGVLVTETVRATGLDVALREALSPWRKPMAVHDPAKVATDLAVALALGGDALADVALLRSEPSIFGPVASDTTVSRTIGLAKIGQPER